MGELPDTSDTLLLKLCDPDDAAAWQQFILTYRPVIYRLARRRGLQDADAEDLAQQVMTAVSRGIGNWRKDSTKGTFRSWLLTIARNESVNALVRGRRYHGRGGTSVLEQMEQLADPENSITALVEDEYRRALFRLAAEHVRNEFEPSTWLAFWRTTVDGLTTEQAAKELDKSLGSVYAARSRVMRRLQQTIREFEVE